MAERRMLLVLDNFEHVVTAAPVVTEILVACPLVKALVTSRAVLRISGERTVAVPPLGVPDLPDGTWPLPAADPDVTLATEAVRLFVDRAQAVKSNLPWGRGMRRSWPRFAGASTDCPWRSSWLRLAFPCCRRPRCLRGWTACCLS